MLVACGGTRSANPSTQAAVRHVLLITIDTLRADRLGCYGSTTVETPNLDRIARDGALMTHVSSHVPLTRPSHVTIFTGLYPAQHNVRDNVSPSLADGIPTLAEQFQAAGFDTAGFVSSVVLSSQSGLARGFQTYSQKFADEEENDARFLNTIQRRGDIATGEAVNWIAAHRANRFFVWLHLYDPHDPYEPPEPYASRYAERPYDGEVAWSDELVGRVDRALADSGIRDDTLVVVTSDHGEGLGEHRESVHGYFVYETTLHVPLVARGPGVKPGARIDATTRLIDLAPTLLAASGIPAPAEPKRPGRSLMRAWRGEEALGDEPAFAESLTPLIHYGWSDLRSVRDGRWKYILAPRPELYDLSRDPQEQNNLEPTDSARARAMRAGLEAQLRTEAAQSRQSTETAAVSPDLLEKLGALGYVSPGAPASGGKTGADPKDKIDEYKTLNRLMREGLVQLRTKDYAGSIERFRALVDRGVDSFEVHYYFARALAGRGACGEASPHYSRAIERLPAFGQAYIGLADCQMTGGNATAAIATLERGVAANPRDLRLLERTAETWRRLERQDKAIALYERELPLAPSDALVRVRLGELYRDAGDTTRSVALLREAVALDPEQASYWNSLGMVLGGSGDLSSAEQAFREAVGRDAQDAQYAFNLGLALERQGKTVEAAGWYSKALDRDPKFAAARQHLEASRRPR
jgi:choline-sulfatase